MSVHVNRQRIVALRLPNIGHAIDKQGKKISLAADIELFIDRLSMAPHGLERDIESLGGGIRAVPAEQEFQHFPLPNTDMVATKGFKRHVNLGVKTRLQQVGHHEVVPMTVGFYGGGNWFGEGIEQIVFLFVEVGLFIEPHNAKVDHASIIESCQEDDLVAGIGFRVVQLEVTAILEIVPVSLASR